MNILRPLSLALAFCVGGCTTQAAGPSSSAPQGQPLATIESLDVARYMGGWYEIAKFPNWFQRNCVGDTKAQYRLLSDGQVEVDNRCRDKSGETSRIVGAARQVGAANSPRLEVRFAPAWLSFVPLVWANYWVVDIDPQYQLAAVSEPGRNYLWILSRTPQVDDSRYQALVERLKGQGFDVARLARTPQSP